MLVVHANSRLPSVRLVPPLKMVFSPPLGYMGVKANVSPQPLVKGNEQSTIPSSSLLLPPPPSGSTCVTRGGILITGPSFGRGRLRDYKDNGGAWSTFPETDEFDVKAGFKL